MGEQEIELPKPTGVPQLVVTHCEAILMDPHVPGRVMVRIKKATPKHWLFGVGTVTSERTFGWRLRIEDRVVRVHYQYEALTNEWRADLLPDGKAGSAVIQLGPGGYQERSTVLDAFCWFVCIAGLILILQTIANNSMVLARTEKMQKTLEELHYKLSLIHSRLPPSTAELLGPRGSPGERGPPSVPLREEDIRAEETFPPGAELSDGASVKLGTHSLHVKACGIYVIAPDGTIRWKFPASGDSGCTLAMQRDGNLVLYHPSKGPMWMSGDHNDFSACKKGVTLTRVHGRLVCQE